MILAIFDFDGTMIAGDSIVSYLRMARERKLIPLPKLLRAGLCACLWRLHLLDAGAAKAAALSFRGKADKKALDRLDRDFARALLTRIRPRALSAMRERKQAGDLVILLTASTDHYMRHVLDGLPADRLICSTTDETGRVLVNVRGEEKVRQLQAFLHALPEQADLAASSAYGDSSGDLPVLRLTGHPYLVNPGRKARRAAAGAIPILTWKD